MTLTNEDLQALSQLLDQKLKTELQPMKEDIHILKEDVSTLKEDVSTLKEDVNILKEDVNILKEDVNILKEDVSTLKEDVSFLKNKTTSLEIHLENVTDRNIQTVAEGHLDLSRKLDEALKVENEKELLIIRVRILEDELRKVKERLNQIA